MIEKLKAFWQNFQTRHPKLAEWLIEGGLFLLVSWMITLFKYLLLVFMPSWFSFLPLRDFGFPGVEITVFGETFRWYIIGYDADHGGLPYFAAYMVTMVIGEVINFFIQRKHVFKSDGNIWLQGLIYLIAFCVITCIVNSINCIWIAVMAKFVPNFIYQLGTTFLNGGISFIIFFFVNKAIFPKKVEKEAEPTI